MRLLLLVLIFWSGKSGLLFAGDSVRFYQPAINLIQGHGFSQDTQGPFHPHADFPPLYSFLMATSLWASGSLIPLLVLQVMLSSLIPLLVWSIAGQFSPSIKVRLSAAVFSSLEPQMILWSLYYITEVLAVFTLLVGLYYFLKVFSVPSTKNAALSGLFVALSALTRPHAQFLVFGGVFVFFILAIHAFKKRNSWKIYTKSGLVFLFIFFLVLSPWLVRNWYHFHTVSVSTTGLRNIYSGIGTSVLSLKTGKPYNEVQEDLHREVSQKYGFDKKEIRENPALGKILAKEGLRIMKENPKETLQTFAIILNSFFTQDLYLENARSFGIIPYFSFGFSPSRVLIKEGPIQFLKELTTLVKERSGLYVLIPLAGKILWIGLSILWIVGAIFALKKGGKERNIALVFVGLILYYAAINLVAGFSDQGRLRYPVNPLIFILASYGFVEVISKKFLTLKSL